MPLFGKTLRDYATFTRIGIALVLLMGLARFFTGISGVPYERGTHLVSLTILTSFLAFVSGHKAAREGFGRYLQLLPAVCMLSVAMYGFIVAAILVEGLGGIHGYFHSPGSGLAPAGMDMANHIGGQLLAMLVSTLGFWGYASLGFLLSRYVGYLRRAFILLAAMAVLRVLVGAAGVPYAIGTWFTSLTLLAILLSVYYGYRGPSSGLTRYPQMLLIGVLIGGWTTLLVVYGIALATSLDFPNYFHAPGEGFMPRDMPVGEHIRGHFLASIVGMILSSFLACLGLVIGKRRSGAAASQAAGA